MSTTVHVKGISSQTSEKEVRDFFSFCGKIQVRQMPHAEGMLLLTLPQSLSVTPESDSTSAPKSASVTFEKPTAAKTALLLDNTQLGPAQVTVSPAKSLEEVAEGQTGDESTTADKDATHVEQEDKPRSRILAEYLAHGYIVSDKAIERAITLDQQHGVSHRFMTALGTFDQKYKVVEKTQQVDHKYGVSTRAQQGWLGLSSYFEKAASTPTGQKLRDFYDKGQKQVMDVHNEAKHLASLKNGKDEGAAGGAAASTTPLLGNAPTSSTGVTVEEAEMEKTMIDGKERTTCNCGGVDGKCPCEPGKCACQGCLKASQ